MKQKTKYRAQTTFEISTMLYLSQLLSVYGGEIPSRWGYYFTRNHFGAPISTEIVEELDYLCKKGILIKDSYNYYSISDETKISFFKSLEVSCLLSWRTKYILAAVDSLLTKPFPKVVDAVQYEPIISSLEKLDRTNILLNEKSQDVLFNDFKVIKEVTNSSQVDLTVPASLWIDYLAIQAQKV